MTSQNQQSALVDIFPRRHLHSVANHQSIRRTRPSNFVVRVVARTMLLLSLAGCGQVDRAIATATGQPSETCVSGVLYLQFTSGASVKYQADGKIAQCSR